MRFTLRKRPSVLGRARICSIVLLMMLGLAASEATAQTYGTVTLGGGFSPNPQSMAGTSGGFNDAFGVYGADCRGWIADVPDHQMIITSSLSELTISVESTDDTTLVVAGPAGVFCNDDSHLFNPAITASFTPGTYNIFVGSYYSEVFAPYTISFSHLGEDPIPSPMGALDTSGYTSNFDGVTLATGFYPDPYALSGTSGGDISASYLGETGTGPCRGHATANPDHLMTLNSSFDFLSVSVSSVGDTTLIIHGPDGWWCNDDSDGVNPAIAGRWIPGLYRIWVGSYGEGQYHSYSISFSEYVPISPTVGSYFQGSFEEMDVYFSGDDADAVYRDCDNFLTSSGGANYVDDITIFGTTHHNGPSYWGQQELCAIVALNVQPQSGSFTALLEGQIEDGVPFSVGGTIDDVRDRLTTYIPMVASSYVDNLNINGVVHHNGPSYWNADAIVAILSYNIEQPGMPVVARGNLEETPFVFAGWSRDDIQTQCVDFVDTIGSTYLDDVVVNGTARHNGPSYWNSTEVCMIVTSLATE